MHPVEEDSRFAIQPVYPDRQALCAEGEEHGKKQPSRLRSGREVPCRFRPASTIFRKLGPNVAKERAGVVLDHPNDPRVTLELAVQLRKFYISVIYNTATGYVLLVYLTNI
jgi:hypothetical protein